MAGTRPRAAPRFLGVRGNTDWSREAPGIAPEGPRGVVTRPAGRPTPAPLEGPSLTLAIDRIVKEAGVGVRRPTDATGRATRQKRVTPADLIHYVDVRRPVRPNPRTIRGELNVRPATMRRSR